jgi:hypothetical protein
VPGTSGAAISGSSTASNCGAEAGNWIDITFTSDEGVTLTQVEWDFSETSVWLDWDGDSMCGMVNEGVSTFTMFYGNGEGNDCQVFGINFTGFNSGDYFRGKCDFDLGPTGCPYSWSFEEGTVTATFSDGTILSGSFTEEFDYPNGATAELGPSLLDFPNLTFVEDDGWTYPCIPSDQANATYTYAPVPTGLVGDAEQTWFSARTTNNGGVLAMPSIMNVRLDGAWTCSHNLWTIEPGGTNGWVNDGPHFVRPGRHTVRVQADIGNDIAEFNETDNIYARQWAWTPPVMGPGTVTRAAPPIYDADREYIDQFSLWWPNCDGLRFETSNTYRWSAVWIEALGDDPVDYRARLHPPSAGVEEGFATYYANSGSSAETRAVLVNDRNVSPFLSIFNVGVINYEESAGTADYRAGMVRNCPYTFDFGVEYETPFFGTRVLIYEFEVGAQDFGPASLVVTTDPEDGPVHMGWLPPDFQYGSLEDLQNEVATDQYGVAVINLDLAQEGYHSAVVYCNRSEHPGGMAHFINLYHGRPDLKQSVVMGWYGPIVPQPHDASALFSCPEPDTLHGNTNGTWLNFACRNGGSAPADSVSFLVGVDGDDLVGITQPGNTLNPGSFRQIRNFTTPSWAPLNIHGGRHTLTVELDYFDWLGELTKVNNNYGRQYCWSPLVIGAGQVVTRNSVPERTGGWEYCEPGQELHWNCDGLRLEYETPSGTGVRRAVAVMPEPGMRNVDLQLHPALVGSGGGFGSEVLATSADAAGAVEFVIVNYTTAAPTSYDVGVLDAPGNLQNGYTAQDVVSVPLYIGGNGTYNPAAMPAGRMMDLWELYFTTGGEKTIVLTDLGAGVDWGMSLYGDGAFLGKNDVLEGCMAQEAPAGGSETITFTVEAQQRFSLAVWKALAGYLDTEAMYNLNFNDSASPAFDSDLPQATGFARAVPNPFNPQTTVHFRLEEAGRCELGIYDVQGRKVRQLVAESLPAGTYQRVWDGKDNAGQTLASGVYMARLVAGKAADLIKLTILK